MKKHVPVQAARCDSAGRVLENGFRLRPGLVLFVAFLRVRELKSDLLELMLAEDAAGIFPAAPASEREAGGPGGHVMGSFLRE